MTNALERVGEKKKTKAELIFEQLSFDKQLKGILSRFARGHLSMRGSVGPEDVSNLLKKYPDDHSFQQNAGIEKFLYEIEVNSGFQKRGEYDGKLRKFRDIVYHQSY